MSTLFKVETEHVNLTWSVPSEKQIIPLGGILSPPGRLVIRKRRTDLTFGENTWRGEVPRGVAFDPEETVGPRLYEQTNYKVFLQAKSESRVALNHRDPLAYHDLSEEGDGRVVFGHINFGSQVGRSLFSVLVDGEPEFDLEVEVFPTKLDYRSDYEQLLVEVQDILTGLALEYLRSTFQFGSASPVPQPTHLEWLSLLRHVVEDLEHALQQVAQQPIRGLTRKPVAVRAERIKRIDSAMRSAIRRGAGSAGYIKLRTGLVIRQVLREQRARQTLDTPEHRWLNAQLVQIRRRLGRLRQEESSLPTSPRRRQTVLELDAIEAKVTRLLGLEPLASTQGDPPPGFASLQLLTAPGYREAYQACLVLTLGLRIEGGPLRLSIKDLSLLYEYWCYLSLLRMVSEMTGKPIPADRLFSIRQMGLRVLLEKGRQTTVSFHPSTGREVTLTYNRLFSDSACLIPQQPDLLITFSDLGWPSLHLILDAKYRVDATQEYEARYGSPGPPQDALNVLHRYRDAILESDSKGHPGGRPKHTVIQAAAAFPYRELAPGAFRNSKLWLALETLGVGAVPLLPGHIQYVEEWLGSALSQGGWALSDRTIAHRAWERAWDWRTAASEPVLVGILRADREDQHMKWINERGLYYMPRSGSQRRQYAVRWLAIYSPRALREPGAITHYAPIEFVDVLRRKEIKTPWPSQHGKAEDMYVLYRLGEFRELEQPIENRGQNGRGQRFSSHRWTSRLGLNRATTVDELSLETEPEWRLYEDLKACRISFRIRAGRVTLVDVDDPTGRAHFVLDSGPVIRYAGAAGFLFKSGSGNDEYYARTEDVLEALEKRVGLTTRSLPSRG